MATTLTRIRKLEAALGGDGGPGCPTCCARPPITGPWTLEREPDRCPQCGARWTRQSFTLRIGPPLGLLDTDAG